MSLEQQAFTVVEEDVNRQVVERRVDRAIANNEDRVIGLKREEISATTQAYWEELSRDTGLSIVFLYIRDKGQVGEDEWGTVERADLLLLAQTPTPEKVNERTSGGMWAH